MKRLLCIVGFLMLAPLLTQPASAQHFKVTYPDGTTCNVSQTSWYSSDGSALFQATNAICSDGSSSTCTTVTDLLTGNTASLGCVDNNVTQATPPRIGPGYEPGARVACRDYKPDLNVAENDDSPSGRLPETFRSRIG
jgi:hypothetical protein